MKRLYILGAAAALSALATAACSGTDAGDLNTDPPPPSGGSQSTTGGSGGSSSTSGGSGTTAGTGGGVLPSGGSNGGGSVGGSTSEAGTSAGGTPTTAGTGGTGGGSAGGGGAGGGGGEVGPYSDRQGTFKMLVLTRTAAFRHTQSIGTGKTMLQQIATEQGFTLAFADSKAEVDAIMTAEGLAQFEIIFHLNTTGDMLTNEQQKVYEDWMTTKNGAFAGVHAATDTENGWAFYSEVTGQYYNGHGAAGTPGQIQFEAGMLEFPAIKGLPNPWQRNEEWYKFDSYQQWSVKPGFKVLGRKAADTQPIMWIREWGNFRAFYTAIGHDGVVFEDAAVKKHLTGGIMWAVRRDKLIK